MDPVCLIFHAFFSEIRKQPRKGVYYFKKRHCSYPFLLCIHDTNTTITPLVLSRNWITQISLFISLSWSLSHLPRKKTSVKKSPTKPPSFYVIHFRVLIDTLDRKGGAFRGKKGEGCVRVRVSSVQIIFFFQKNPFFPSLIFTTCSNPYVPLVLSLNVLLW